MPLKIRGVSVFDFNVLISAYNPTHACRNTVPGLTFAADNFNTPLSSRFVRREISNVEWDYPLVIIC